MEVIFSTDVEGNAFTPVTFGPEIGVYHQEDKEFQGIDEDNKIPNAICLN